MAIINAAQAAVKTVADPNASYESLKPLWVKSRAVCSGERFVKDYDSLVDSNSFTNLLIPFSPTMTQRQYNFYKAEAELPGIVAQFARMLVGGLLRKKPSLSIPKDAPAEAYDWIMNDFGQDDSSLSSFLDTCLWEEIQTSRAWIYVDYPSVNNIENLTREDLAELKPYPILWQAESIINWRAKLDTNGKNILDRVIVRGFVERFDQNEFHPSYIDTVWVHELDESGYYQIRRFERDSPSTNVQVVTGQKQSNAGIDKSVFVFKELTTNIQSNGERLNFIPAWPLNGSIEVIEPILTPIIDKEISLYNKISRRNHLLYGASTYTPIILSDMTDEQFEDIVASGLGTWIRLRQGDDAKVLETPTSALQDMDRAISQSIEEMAKLGVRMLSPETSQSGVALQLRNAAQTAQLGSLNNKISNTMSQIIAFMLNWRYGTQYKAQDIEFSLSDDFNNIPIGADWLRLATEWYQGGLIPRSTWLEILKQNDMINPDYNDEEGRMEITQDLDLAMKVNEQYSRQLESQTSEIQNNG